MGLSGIDLETRFGRSFRQLLDHLHKLGSALCKQHDVIGEEQVRQELSVNADAALFPIQLTRAGREVKMAIPLATP